MCIKRRAQCPAPTQFHPVVAGLGFCWSGSLTVSNSHVLRLSEAGRLFPRLSGSSLTLSQRLGSQTPDTDRPKGSSLWSQTTRSSQNESPWTRLPPPHTQAPAPRALRADLALPPRSPGCSFCSSLKDSHPPRPCSFVSVDPEDRLGQVPRLVRPGSCSHSSLSPSAVR